MLSQTFAGLQKQLGDEVNRGHMVSVWIDTGDPRLSLLPILVNRGHMVSVWIDPAPEPPERPAESAKRYGAGPQWNDYTGNLEASVEVGKA